MVEFETFKKGFEYFFPIFFAFTISYWLFRGNYLLASVYIIWAILHYTLLDDRKPILVLLAIIQDAMHKKQPLQSWEEDLIDDGWERVTGRMLFKIGIRIVGESRVRLRDLIHKHYYLSPEISPKYLHGCRIETDYKTRLLTVASTDKRYTKMKLFYRYENNAYFEISCTGTLILSKDNVKKFRRFAEDNAAHILPNYEYKKVKAVYEDTPYDEFTMF